MFTFFQDGAHLVSIENEYEFALIATIPKLTDDLDHLNESDIWIGLYSQWSQDAQGASAFKWTDGEPVKFLNWAPDEPNLNNITAANPLCVHQATRYLKA